MSKKGNRPVPWSPEDTAKLKLMIDQRVSHDEMAVELVRTKGAVRAKNSQLLRGDAKADGSQRQRRRNNGAQFFLS